MLAYSLDTGIFHVHTASKGRLSRRVGTLRLAHRAFLDQLRRVARWGDGRGGHVGGAVGMPCSGWEAGSERLAGEATSSRLL